MKATSDFERHHRARWRLRVAFLSSVSLVVCALTYFFVVVITQLGPGKEANLVLAVALFLFSIAACGFMVWVLTWVKSQRDKEEKTLHQTAQRYKSIIAVSLTGAWEFHRDTGYLWCSPEYYTMLGYDEPTFLHTRQRNVHDVWMAQLHPDDALAATSRFNAYLTQGSVGMYESVFRLRHRDGSWLWILSRGQTLRTVDGAASNITLGTHINITDKKNLELELRKHYAQLLRYSFSNAHQVRGPVARMLGLLNLATLEESVDYVWLLDKVEHEVQDLDRIIGTIGKELDEIVKHTPEEVVK